MDELLLVNGPSLGFTQTAESEIPAEVIEAPIANFRIDNHACDATRRRDEMTDFAASDDLWFRRFHSVPAHGAGDTLLACFPHAGGSASSFFSLSRSLAGVLEVMAVQYPGRQERRAESCFRSLTELADQIFPVLKPLTDRPLALFGHSMGAIVAFEMARRLENEDGTSPVALFVSGRRAPFRYRAEHVHQQDDHELAMTIKELSGTDTRILDDEELLQMVLPVIRSDYRAIETYQYQDGPKLHCPVHAFIGDADPQATIEEVIEWEKCTTERFTLSVFPGGHFYLNEHQTDVTRAVATYLAREH